MREKEKLMVEMDVSSLADGVSRKITKIGDGIVMSDLDVVNVGQSVKTATYDFEKTDHLYSRIAKEEAKNYIVTEAELDNLAKNPQNDVNKIIKINGIVQYYANKDDLIGKVNEIIENNINTKYSIEFPNIPVGKAKKKKKQNAETVINKFNECIDIEELIVKNVIFTYSEGNYIPYLRGDINKGYSIENYPLGLIQISNHLIDGEPMVVMDIDTLKKNLRDKDEFRKLKSASSFNMPKSDIEEIERNYPPEVTNSYK